MDDETKKANIEQVQIDNNYPGLERLVKLVITKYPDDITRRDVKRFLANDAITQQTKVQQQPRKKADEPTGHVTAFQPNE